MIFTTSYKSFELKQFITSFVQVINPALVVEIGAQQGASAITICSGMNPQSVFRTYDLFEPAYLGPPYLSTHADIDLTRENLKQSAPLCSWSVHKGDHILALSELGEQNIDLLHIDICNHLDNVKPILYKLESKVTKAILLEGGNLNHWHKLYGYKSFAPLFDDMPCWDHITLATAGGTITILTRRTHE